MRYADDQVIFLNDASKVESLLLLLSRNLDRYGLRINQKKVFVWTTNDFSKHRCKEIQAIFEKNDDKKNPDLVKQFVDTYLAVDKTELEKSWNAGMPLLNRLLWSNIDSLPPDQFNRILDRLTTDQFILFAKSNAIKRIYELNSKRCEPINFIELLKRIGDKTVHDAYHYEVVAFANSINSKELSDYFKKRIESLRLQLETYTIS